MIKLYCGYDPLEAIGYHVFCSSVIRKASKPVAFVPLHLPMLDEYQEKHHDGTNAFIYSRFLIPYQLFGLLFPRKFEIGASRLPPWRMTSM